MAAVVGSSDTARGSRGRTFASLRVRNYRMYAGGQAISLVGTWMQRVAQDWLVLDLTGGNAIALGTAAALQFGPMLALTLWGGVLADRYDKRRMLLLAQLGMGGCALVLGLLDVSALVQLWQVYLLCVLLGCFAALDMPVRQSFVSEMVGAEQVPNAVALNSMTFNTARIVGPAIAGLLIAAVGTGWVFLINTATFAAVVVGLARIDPARLFRRPRPAKQPGALRAGLSYVRRRPALLGVLALVFFVSTFGINFYMTLALLARNVFGLGPESYGLLTALLAVGSLAGALLAARRVGRPRLRVVYGSALAFGVLEIVAGLMPTFALVGLMLIPVGVAALLFTTAANATVQLSVAESMRGRVMGLYMLLFLGATPLGAPLLEVLAENLGGRAPVVAGGVASVLSVLAVAGFLTWRRKRGLAVKAKLG